MRQKEEEEQRNRRATEVSATEVENPVASVPQDLPVAHVGVDTPSSALQDTEPTSALRSVESSPETFVDPRVSAVSSPTSSISTVSDLSPTELGDDIGEGNGKRTNTHHDTFYFEDGDVEIVCQDTVFRVHSTIISFASATLRDILSQSARIHPPMLRGRPRISFDDSVEDFAVLLKMVYTPGWVSPPPKVGLVNGPLTVD